METFESIARNKHQKLARHQNIIIDCYVFSMGETYIFNPFVQVYNFTSVTGLTKRDVVGINIKFQVYNIYYYIRTYIRTYLHSGW